ncbi:rod shape-determining protein MreC [Rhodospirillum centenum]|uniref:Cell shape-determining protein MreC n=1 Tax=Rhodospirillum centenum (strain ATCC 51521 / SW) TaxID=414684 RepID=B6ITR0_RHOCS|nr:rod shape-determining protein MreC [Rhodospirillum centenum]ACI99361.1 rod shape-determining protein MreC, putative [Rhodospirillum centenum SW]
MKTRNGGTVVRIAAPLWALLNRFYFLLLIVAAVALMVFGRVDAVVVDHARARVTDAFAPVLDVLSRPAAAAADVIESIRQLARIHGENQRLREENARLLQWQQAALRLDAENRSLRSLLAYRPDPAVSFITARVIADPGSAFLHTLVVTAGRRDGVKRGQAAMAGQGLVGRVVQVGEWSSRILLMTDINARIPVVLETSRRRAMLAGDNTERPRLMYMQRGAEVIEGERVFTSGHGGLFPPGLPMGMVTTGGGEPRVVPMVDLTRIEHVQLVDFGIPGGLAAEAVQPGAMQ